MNFPLYLKLSTVLFHSEEGWYCLGMKCIIFKNAFQIRSFQEGFCFFVGNKHQKWHVGLFGFWYNCRRVFAAWLNFEEFVYLFDEALQKQMGCLIEKKVGCLSQRFLLLHWLQMKQSPSQELCLKYRLVLEFGKDLTHSFLSNIIALNNCCWIQELNNEDIRKIDKVYREKKPCECFKTIAFLTFLILLATKILL